MGGGGREEEGGWGSRGTSTGKVCGTTEKEREGKPHQRNLEKGGCRKDTSNPSLLFVWRKKVPSVNFWGEVMIAKGYLRRGGGGATLLQRGVLGDRGGRNRGKQSMETGRGTFPRLVSALQGGW